MMESLDVVFCGNDESECIDFIRAVRKHAKQNNKIRDTKWIADELYDSFDGEALRWYVHLPLNVREDWELLQQALATRWIPKVDTPWTSTQGAKVGRVRIWANGDPEVRYLSKNPRTEASSDFSGSFGATTNAALAMKVRLTMVAPTLYRLELLEHESKLSVLAAFNYWSDSWNLTGCWGHLVGVDAPGQGSLKGRRTTYAGPDSKKARQFWTETWQLESTRRLRLRGSGDPTEAARFALGSTNKNKDILWFCGPKETLDSTVVEADLEFEPSEN